MQRPRLHAVIALLFACSGFSGLVYEITWSKYLSLLLGSTAYAHMIVLATFMGGLALGARYWGARADRAANPLRLYAVLELVIGLYCALYPLLMLGAERLFLAAVTGLGLASHGILLGLLKFTLSAVTLLVPTFCMGGTLPILLKPLAGSLEESGTAVARLYWVNSAGAVAGAALAGFVLIRALSLDGALWTGAAVNIGVGLAALALSRGAVRAAAPPAPRAVPAYPPRAVRIAVATAAACGFLAMVYELAWIRLLATLLGSSTYSFTVMLVAFIAGIALGSWLVSRILRRRRDLLALLAWCQLGTALFMLATLPGYERLPFELWRLSGALGNAPGAFPLFLACEFLFCLALMIVPTTLSGMSLPVAGRIASGEITALGRSIGGVFSVNTIGAVAGALATGLVLIPLLGVKQSIEAAVAANALLGLAILWSGGRMPRGRVAAIAGLLLAAGAAYRVAVPAWNENVSSVGVYRAFFKAAPPTYDAFLEGLRERTVLWYREGVSANVAVNEFTNDDGRRERSLVINGKADASTERDLPTQVLLAQIPMMLAPDSGDVLVIGLGSGITPGSALKHPVRRLDCVEIAGEVVECNRFFAEANGRVLDDPRMRMHVDDAITFVKTRPERYAAIISEPSNPWIAGIGNLFTAEFFALCRARLAPGGVLAQWFHTYDADDAVFAMVVRTLRTSFPHVTVWTPTDDDVILLASSEPVRFDAVSLERRWRRPGVAGEFARIGMASLPAFLATQRSGESFRLADGPVNTEKRPLVEFLAPISFFTHARVNAAALLGAEDSTTLLAEYRRVHGLRARDELDIARYLWHVADDDPFRAVSALESSLRLSPDDTGALALYATIAGAMGRTEVRLAALRRLAELTPDEPLYQGSYAVELAQAREAAGEAMEGPDAELALRLLRRCVELTAGGDERYLLRLAEMLSVTGRHAEAAAAYRATTAIRAGHAPVETGVSDAELLARAAREYLDADRPADAAPLVAELAKIEPAHADLPELRRQLVKEHP